MFGTFSNQNTSGGNAFGGNAQQPQQSGTSSGGNMFGSAQPAGGSLFGSAPNQSSNNPLLGSAQGTSQTTGGGGLFGNTSAPNQGGGGGGGGLFGNANTQNQPATGGGGGLFGGGTTSNTGGNPLFGNAQASTSNTTGGGLFGSTTAGTNTGTTGGGLFGNAGSSGSANPSGGGLFGSNIGGGTNTTGGGLFGSTTGNTGTTGGGLFGGATGSNTGTTGGGLFGSSNTTSGGGLFGSTTGTSTGTAGGGLFGSAPSTTGGGFFGSTQQGSSSMLGQPPQQGSLFGGTPGRTTQLNTLLTTSLARSFMPPNQQQADAQAQFTTLLQRLESIAQAWNPNSPQCRFQHYFYNLVDPRQVQLYGRPPIATSDALWQKAVRENPDPSCFVPVIATSFDDLQMRVEAQSQQAAAHQEKLKELQQRIEALAQRHQLSNASRLSRAALLQTQLTHRVLKLVQHLHLLIPALRSSAIRPEEEALRTALEDIDQEVRRPGGTGRMRGKLNELWALVGAVSAARERDRRDGTVEWTVVDEEGLRQIAQILAEEQAGLAHLTKILQRDLRDLAVIQGTSAKEEEPDVLLASASRLRGSTAY